jgi:hypothetical protein
MALNDPIVPTATTGTPTSFPSTQAFDDGSTLQTFDDGSTLATAVDGTLSSSPAPTVPAAATEPAVNPPTTPTGDTNSASGGAQETGATNNDSTSDPTPTTRSGVPPGAEKKSGPGSTAQWAEAKDLRVKLRVPKEYLSGKMTAGPSNTLSKNGGILFPYTPQISISNTANYKNESPLHSNFPLYFYNHSSVGPIKVTAKFTVQNEFEGAVLLSVIHLLRALTKMKWGDDVNAGSPPPVCRFDAYGDSMMFNVPVSVASWSHELPEGVDYIAVGRPGSATTYGHSMVPVVSSISLDLNIMYSRKEMMEHGVDKWLAGSLRGKGYL